MQCGISVGGGSVVSFKPGAKTLDVGSQRFAMSTGSVNGGAALQPFKGRQEKGLGVSLCVILGGWAFLIFMLHYISSYLQ